MAKKKVDEFSELFDVVQACREEARVVSAKYGALETRLDSFIASKVDSDSLKVLVARYNFLLRRIETIEVEKANFADIENKLRDDLNKLNAQWEERFYRLKMLDESIARLPRWLKYFMKRITK